MWRGYSQHFVHKALHLFFTGRRTMKALRYKTKLLLGFILFLSGTLMLQTPIYINFDQHVSLRQLLLVTGAIAIFFGFALILLHRQ